MTQAEKRTSHRFLLASSGETMHQLTDNSSDRTHHDQVAAILQRCTCDIIDDWLGRVKKSKELNQVRMTDEERTGYLPKLIDDLIVRLRKSNTTNEENGSGRSDAAVAHGQMRRSQGYSLAMLVHDSRFLEVALFETLHKNRNTLDFNLLLSDVITIADEVDSQLTQAMGSHTAVQNRIAA